MDYEKNETLNVKQYSIKACLKCGTEGQRICNATFQLPREDLARYTKVQHCTVQYSAFAKQRQREPDIRDDSVLFVDS